MTNKRKAQSGFTLIELLVVVLIIGILAAIAVPQYFKVTEKGKVSEAMSTLDSIRGAQERYLANTGGYCGAAFTSCTGWDLPMPTLKYFTIAAPTATGTPSWQVVLTRSSSTSPYGAYTVTYGVSAGAAPTYTCAGSSGNCQNDLMPQ